MNAIHAPRRSAMVIIIAAAVSALAQAQTDPISFALTNYAEFQYSTLTASLNSITATWVPIVTASGTTYVNVTLPFTVNAAGNLTVGKAEVIQAPITIIGNFVAGNYAGPSNLLSGNDLITVSSPGVTTNGATEWSLVATSGAASCSYPNNATWYVGPITSNPWYTTRIQPASITSTAWYYGVGDSTSCGYWPANSLLGFSQTGNQLTIVNFTGNGKDNPAPVDSLTFTLKQ